MMKNILLTLLTLLFGLTANAQKDTSSVKNTKIDGNNELKINLAFTLAGIAEIGYERILKDDMSVGLALLVGLEKNSEYVLGLVPNFRVYFGAKKANGFFIEGNAAVISLNDYESYYNYDPNTNSYIQYLSERKTSFGLGAAAGAKFLTKNGFIGEIYLGGGRLFANSAHGAYLRGGVTIGKRF